MTTSVIDRSHTSTLLREHPQRSRTLRYLPLAALILDGLVLLGIAIFANELRHTIPALPQQELRPITVALFPSITVCWLVVMWLGGGYTHRVFGVGTYEFRRVANSSLIAAGLLGAGCYLVDAALPRSLYAMIVVLGVPALLTGRVVLRKGVHRLRRSNSLLHNVLIVGDATGVDNIARVLRRDRRLGYRVIGALVTDGDPGTLTPDGVPVLGPASKVTPRIIASGADVVFFAEGGARSARRMRRIAWDLERHHIHLVMAPSVSEVAGDRVSIRPVGGLPLVHIDPPRTTDASRLGKRLFDVVGSLALLIVVAPLLALCALLIKLEDGGPVLFRQTRVGRQGKEFAFLKLRTMVVDAEERLLVLQDAADVDPRLFKMQDDPRITRPGRWMRRFSVDELPQLVNVLRGEMSLVGPRPPLPREVAQYEGHMHRRLHVRPGLTGLWQVSGRSDLSFDEAIRLDLYYVDNWSMMQDLSILARTASAVVRSRGAY